MSSLPFLLLSLISSTIFAASLPSGLSRPEIERAVETIGQGGATRLLRSAEAYESWPGFKIGLECAMFSSRSLDQMGALDGSLPSLLLVPRLHVTKGLFLNLEAVFSVLPGGIINSFSTYGGILKWTFLSEKDNFDGSIAVYTGFTKITGLRFYDGNDFEFGIVASRDFVRIKPFLGLGILMARGEVSGAATTDNKANHTSAHLSMGFEWELPLNVTAQIDFFNLNFAGSLFIGKRF